MISYGKQYIDKNDINNVTKTLKSSYLTQGPNVIKFENKLIANNLTSLIINIYYFSIFFIGVQNFNKTNVQLILIAINLIIYICLYILLNRFKKNLQK